MNVVGIGASAGGIEALKILLGSLKKQDNASYIIAQHISPTHVSMLKEIFTRQTDLNINIAETGIAPEPGNIYVIPPNANVTFSEGIITLHDATDLPSPKPSINQLFESLADNFGTKSIGIILSGTGSDGAAGLMAIRQSGGITVAQDPATAEYASMPLSAIQAGAVDLTLPLPDIAGVIHAAGKLKTHDQQPNSEWTDDYITLVEKINEAANIDLSQYKTSSLKRRIDRRMALRQISDIASYIDYINKNDDEVHEFVKDVFISVTEFFRDKSVFDFMKVMLKEKLKGFKKNQLFRVWIPGCATGEEAYTYAILLDEIQKEDNLHFDYRILATDISERALEVARKGYYSDVIKANIDQQRLQKYFTVQPNGYQVNKDIRDKIIFSRHDLVKDAPFAALQLISCRNVLIYFKPELQDDLFNLFNFALEDDGILLLGRSESAKSQTETFKVIDKDYRVYKKTGQASSRARRGIFNPIQNNAYLGYRSRSSLTQNVRTNTLSQKNSFLNSLETGLLLSVLHEIIITNIEGKIIYISEAAGKFINKPTGFISDNVVDNMSDALSMVIRPMLFKAQQQLADNCEVLEPITRFITLAEMQNAYYRLRATPLNSNGVGLIAIIFDHIWEEDHAKSIPTPVKSNSEFTALNFLNDELSSTRESLQTIIEEYETTNEELQSANEEMMSSNEELQATNEELQTTNEELQSTNEELVTVNDELNFKNHQLDNLNLTLQKIERSLKLPFIQVDTSFNVIHISSTMSQINLEKPPEIGRNILDNHFLSQFGDQKENILETLHVNESDSNLRLTIKDKAYLLKISMVRDGESLDGRIIWFDNIHESSAIANKEREALNIALNTLNAIGDAVIRTDSNGIITLFNSAAELATGLQAEDAMGLFIGRVLKPEDENHPIIGRLINVKSLKEPFKTRTPIALINTQGKAYYADITTAPFFDNSQKFSGLVILFKDVTDRQLLAKERDWHADHDYLTGLINRGSAERIIRKSIYNDGLKDGIKYALLFMDLDGFKSVNDSAGHDTGDAILKEVVNRIKSHLRRSDLFARIGGDEFVIYLLGTAPFEAHEIALELIRVISSEPFKWGSREYSIGLSIGLFVSDELDSHNFQDMLIAADAAMYRAKEQGGNKVILANQGSHKYGKSNNTETNIYRLQQCPTTQSLRVVRQPIIDTASHSIAGYEFLMRFKDQYGELTPEELIKTSERYSMIHKLDIWIIELAFKAIANIRAQDDENVFYSINLSGQSFNNLELFEKIEALANDYEIDPKRLILEITERAFLPNFNVVNQFIAKAHELGARVYLDDFGSGLSSFEYLKALNIDGVKIDGQFVTNINKSALDHEIVESIVRICKTLGIPIIAEYVENADIADAIAKLNIEYQQGFYHSEPEEIAPMRI